MRIQVAKFDEDGDISPVVVTYCERQRGSSRMKSAEHKSESLHGPLISHIFFTEALNETCDSI
jgi:hypothetical protein